MTPIIAAYAIGIGSLTVVFLLLSLLKTALRTLNHVTLRRLADDDLPGRRRRLLEEYLDSPTELVLRLQTVIQASLVFIAVLATGAAIHLDRGRPMLLAALGLGLFVLFFEHLFARFVLSVDRERLLIHLLPAYELLDPAIRLVSAPVNGLLRTVLREHPTTRNGGEVSDEDIQAFIDVGEKAGILDGDEGEYLESLVDFGDTLVREVMTPRVDMVGVEAATSVAATRDLMIQSKHSRLPVFREKIDAIEGWVHIKDLLEAWRDGREADEVRLWMKPTGFVPDIKKVSSLLRDFQRDRTTFAVVVDEFGGTSGLVTMEDLLEELVGEIDEQQEDASASIVEEEGGSYLMSAKVEIEKLDEIFGVEVEAGNFGTLAGLVVATLGRVPIAGEEFCHAGLEFRVLEADRRRVKRVRVKPAPTTPAEPAGGPA